MLYSGGGGGVSTTKGTNVTPLSTPVPRTTGAASSSRSELDDLELAKKLSRFDSLVARPVGASSSIRPVSDTRELDDLELAKKLSRLEAENQKKLEAESLKKFDDDTALAMQKSLTTAKPADKQEQLIRQRLERERERERERREADIRRTRKMRKSKRRITRRKRRIKSKRKTRRRH